MTALREEIARLKAEIAQLKFRDAERTAKVSGKWFHHTLILWELVMNST